MKKQACVLTAAICTLSGIFNPVMAEQVQAGVIYFYGQVVETPCQLDAVNHQVFMDCPNQKTVRISTQQLEKGNIHNENIRSAQIRYLNPQKTLAIVEVDYR
ncbi:type 1 fimbrial protein [Klebsiella oxytoca]|uniref:Type 1 fimbrial protein n=1 Tax=Klebsiella oxytoca TaxID=571 RepID=A0A6B8MX39_KLEOX|nr:type 1 fimbrial protein [Klebsiella oxytoca]QGN37608.1 type 1 fimbrial protein [Klebsiella oxytoca]